jgi:hypothetical protein
VSAEHAVDPVAMITETLPVAPRWLGVVRDAAPEWSAAFEAVRREWFVPRIVWRRNPYGRGWLAVDRVEDPRQWAEMVDRDDFVVTQVDDGQPCLPGGVGRAVTSSTSMPSTTGGNNTTAPSTPSSGSPSPPTDNTTGSATPHTTSTRRRAAATTRERPLLPLGDRGDHRARM